jgi:hypothetical protein
MSAVGPAGAFLTAAEHELVELLGACASRWAQIVSHQPSRAGDINEFVLWIHACQHAVLAQAAARAYPERYRLAGAIIEPPTIRAAIAAVVDRAPGSTTSVDRPQPRLTSMRGVDRPLGSADDGGRVRCLACGRSLADDRGYRAHLRRSPQCQPDSTYPEKGGGDDGRDRVGDVDPGETTHHGPLDAGAIDDGADSHDVGRTLPEPPPATNGVRPRPPPGGPPAPPPRGAPLRRGQPPRGAPRPDPHGKARAPPPLRVAPPAPPGGPHQHPRAAVTPSSAAKSPAATPSTTTTSSRSPRTA